MSQTLQLPSPKVSIPETNRFRDEQREKAHEIGLSMIAYRQAHDDVRPIGIKAWLGRCAELGWPMEPRRMNELADSRLWVVRPWVCLPVKYKDALPSMTYQTRQSLQSAYLPSPAFANEYEAYCEKATGMDIIKFLGWIAPP